MRLKHIAVRSTWSSSGSTIALAAAAFALAGGSGSARAQEPAKELPASQSTGDEGEREDAGAPVAASPSPAEAEGNADIVITGSRIRGVGAVGSNVVSVGADFIEQTAPLSVSDLLKDVPQVVNLGYDEASFASTTGIGNVTRASGVNIHGLGPQATLVLFDGHRFSQQGPQASLVDPSSIPTIAIERVEVVPDGASAIYGSDAVAGVVNLIPRQSYDGVMVTARAGIASHYDQQQASAIVGKKWDGGGAWLAAEYSRHGRLRGRDRTFFQSDLRSRGGADYRSFQCNPGNILIGGVSYAIPSGSPVTPASLVRGTANRCDVLGAGDIIPEQERYSVAARAFQELGDHVSLWAEGFYSKRTFDVNVTNQGSTSVLANLVVPRTNAFFVAPVGMSPATETIQYSFDADFGPIRQTGYDKTGDIYVGANVDLPSRWKLSVTGLYGRNDSLAENLQINAAALTPLLASSNPAIAFNPYGPGRNSPAMLNQIFSFIFRPFARNTISGGEARADGPLFRLPGGEVRLAIGAESLRYAIDGFTERGPIGASTKLPSVNNRRVNSAYAELYVPIVGEGNGMPLIRRLDLSIAGRVDDYSDVGSTWNPKIGLTWRLAEGLELKGSYGTSFRAPLLTETLAFRPGTAITPATLPDPLSPTGQSTGIRFVAGNPNLTPEEAETYSIGVTYRPPAVKGLYLNATYFSINYSNQISSQIQNNAILQQEALYSALITRNPTPAQIAELLARGYPVTGVLPPNPAFIINGQPQNLGTTIARGVDFVALYDWDSEKLGKFEMGVSGTYNTAYKVAQTPVAPLLKVLNTINNPIRFRSRGNLGWARGGFSSQLFVNYYGSYRNNTVTPVQKVKAWTTADIHVGYDVDRSDDDVGTLNLSLNVENLFGARPPFVDVQGGYDFQQASAVGRRVIFGVSTRF